jgi:hypothetical protein
MASVEARQYLAPAEEGRASPEAASGEGPKEGVIAVFRDRDRLEQAMEGLQEHGFNRSRIHLLSNVDAAKRLGVAASEGEAKHPVDRAEQGNIQGMLAGIPTYIGALLAAGVTVASGGTFAGVALAAVGGAVGAGAIGAGAAKLFNDRVAARYGSELESGGIVVLVTTAGDSEVSRASDILTQHGGKDVSKQSFGG